MTIAPLPVLPPAARGARAADATSAKPGQPAAADDFASLLDGQLAGSTTAAPQAQAPQQDETEPAPPAVDAEAGTLEALLAGTVLVAATPTAAPAAAASAAVVAAVAATVGDGVAAVAAAEAAPPVVDATTTAGDALSAPTVATTVPAGPAGSPVDADAATPTPRVPADAGGLADVVVETAGTAVDVDGTAAAVPAPAELADAATPTANPITGGVPAPAAAPAVVTPTSAATPASAPPSPVLAQVTPALARVVSRGDGEHRMMLKLHPADLGEVHLTVTVRGDHVDVEIAAGAAARDVLRDGSAQLRSLLESIGRSTGQLVLRDLPVAPTPAAGPGAGASGHQGTGASYAGTGDGRRDQPDARGGHRQPHATDQPVNRPLVTPRASGRTTVPGGPALDVTV